MSISTPYGMSYSIHGHNGYQGSERIPHVHIKCQGERISVSLQDGSIIVGQGDLDRNKEKEVLEWVRSHMSELWDEWQQKSDPYK